MAQQYVNRCLLLYRLPLDCQTRSSLESFIWARGPTYARQKLGFADVLEPYLGTLYTRLTRPAQSPWVDQLNESRDVSSSLQSPAYHRL